MDREWRPVFGYEGLYEVSEYGDVRSVTRVVPSRHKTRTIAGQLIKRFVDKYGYYRVCLCAKNKRSTKIVHRLVAEAFIQNPCNYPVVNHKDEDKTNNDYRNLEWCTVRYNTLYGNAMEKMASKRRKKIKAFKDGDVILFASITEASRVLNVSHGNISGCVNKRYGRKTCKGYTFDLVKERMVQRWKREA